MKYRILYFAILRDASGCDQEDIESGQTAARALYMELQCRHGFAMKQENLRIAVNGEFATWDRALADGDEIVFIPPVSGG